MTTSLNELAQKIDVACEVLDAEELERLLDRLNNLPRKTLSIEDTAAVNFFKANAYAGLRQAYKEHESWSWIQPRLENEIYHLRLAFNTISSIPVENLTNDLRFRIVTNLANALDHIGRVVEAIELWDSVIDDYPKFSMAIGNKALALFRYARFLDRDNTQPLFLKHSHLAFKKALSIGVESHATESMSRKLMHLESLANWDDIRIEEPRQIKSRTKLEHQYREWCVNNRLALNPLNDLLGSSMSLFDTLTLPSIRLPIEEGGPDLPKSYGIFNQLKQEYVSARFLIFEALKEKNNRGLHFSDRGVTLYDALDYRYYRLWVEKLKMAFLSSHAIFDKIAYLINEHWKLGLPVHKVDLRSVWLTTPKLSPNPIFLESDNWPLRGLFWLSKDIYHKSNADQAIDPEAKIIHDIRNHIAHKYLRVHDHYLYGASKERERHGHALTYPVSDLELQTQSIKLLKLVRSALFYLSFAVKHHEQEKLKDYSPEYFATMPITEVGDKYRL